MNTLLNNSTHSFYTRFYPALQSFTGSAFSTLIIGKLEYWFSFPKYVNGFYKFVEPCGHPLYRNGDSWSEELGVSRKIFAKAFDIIGIRYSSKSAFLQEQDPFKGKLYASYHDRSTNQTYYVRNHAFVADILNGLFTKKKTSPLQNNQKKKETSNMTKRNVTFSSQENTETNREGKREENKQEDRKGKEKLTVRKETRNKNWQPIIPQDIFSPQNSLSSFPSQGRSWNGHLGRSYAHVPFSLQKETSSLTSGDEKSSPHALDVEDLKVTEGMIKIWNEEIGDLGICSVTPHFSKRLLKVFVNAFGSSIEAWKTYCRKISSSKFLMGEAQNRFFKKAWITWAICPENIERIKAGEFKLGDRQTNQDKEIETLNHKIQAVEIKKRHIESQIANLRLTERKRKKDLVKERINNLSEQEKHDFEQAFEEHLTQENNSLTEEFKRLRWKGLFIATYFDGFVEDKIYTRLFGKRNKEDQGSEERLIQSSGFLKLLDDVNHEIACLIKEKGKNTTC